MTEKVLGTRGCPCWPAGLLLALVVTADGALGQQPGEGAAPALTAADVLARARPAVVAVLTDADGDEMATQGSGFIVSADGLVVTAWHVIAGATEAAIKLADGARLPVAGVAACDLYRDFAVLKVAGKGLATIRLGDSDGLRQGDKILALASPGGLGGSASEGTISAVHELPDGGKLIETTARLSPGSSGGPLLDMRSRAVGVAWGGEEDQPEVPSIGV